MRRAALAALFGGLALLASGAAAAPTVRIGSKAFPESWILGEAAAIRARNTGARVQHRHNLGGTEIVYEALRSGDIDLYPEYTGTIAEVILKDATRPSLAAMRRSLAPFGIGVGEPLGFEDSYAIALTRDAQQRTGVRALSDLARHPEIRLGLSHEFLGRADGWPGLASAYDLRLSEVSGIQHELAYEALAAGRIDGTDIYTTDAQIEALDLRVLADDRGFFPRYEAVWLYRLDLEVRAPEAFAAVRTIEGTIDEPAMIRANGDVQMRKRPFAEAAAALVATGGGGIRSRPTRAPSLWASIARNTGQHVRLVAISLLAAIVVGIPLGIAAARSPALGRLVLGAAGLLQTIPSLALLALLIPLLGIGTGPALVALFLYGLLPIVRNTSTALTTIPPALLESAEALGLSPRSQLFRVKLPLASPAILAGIQTSAVINVGTATIAALIGAGGLGEPILSGIQLRDRGLLLQGALPAAALALAVAWGFEWLERRLVPRGIRREVERTARATPAETR